MNEQHSPNDNLNTHLSFSDKYNSVHSENYYKKHKSSLQRNVSNWLEQRAARRAIVCAGNPISILDLPCGAGRFWALLAEHPTRQLVAADYSQSMLDVAMCTQPPTIAKRFECTQASVFDTRFPDAFVDCVFTMRFMHHVSKSQDRLTILREFRRICRDTVIVSLWVNGNFKAWKRKRLEAKRAAKGDNSNNRFVTTPFQFEEECKQAGLEVVNYYDVLPLFLMWRIYVLRKVT